ASDCLLCPPVPAMTPRLSPLAFVSGVRPPVGPAGVFRDERPFDELVQPIEVDVGKDGADNPALRRAAEGGVPLPVLHVSGLEQSVNQPEEAVIVDLLAEDRQQDVSVDVVEAPLDVALDEPLRTGPGVGYRGQRRMTAASWPEAVGRVGELRLVVGVQKGAHYLL